MWGDIPDLLGLDVCVRDGSFERKRQEFRQCDRSDSSYSFVNCLDLGVYGQYVELCEFLGTVFICRLELIYHELGVNEE